MIMDKNDYNFEIPEIRQVDKADPAAIKKVPGQVAAIGKLSHEANAVKAQLNKKSVRELEDLLARQNVILNSPKLCDRLPDKGDKVRAKKEAIQALISERNRSLDEALKLLDGLSIKDGKASLEEMEWKYGSLGIKGLTQRSMQQQDNQTIKALAEKEVPFTQLAVVEDELEADLYVKRLWDRSAQVTETHKFRPFSNSHKKTTEEFKKAVKLTKTPGPKKPVSQLMPLPEESDREVQVLSLQASLRVQSEQSQSLKRVLEKQACEVLKSKSVEGGTGTDDLIHFPGKMEYRVREEVDDDDDEEEKVVAFTYAEYEGEEKDSI